MASAFIVETGGFSTFTARYPRRVSLCHRMPSSESRDDVRAAGEAGWFRGFPRALRFISPDAMRWVLLAVPVHARGRTRLELPA